MTAHFQTARTQPENRLAVGDAQHLLDLTERGRGIGIQSAQAAHGQHQHVELQRHLAAPIVDDAGLAIHGQAVGMPAALLSMRANDIVYLLVFVRHVQLLAGHDLMFVIEPGALGKKAPAKAQITSVIVFEANVFQGLLHGAPFLLAVWP